jgi:hypothetical protein
MAYKSVEKMVSLWVVAMVEKKGCTWADCWGKY